MSFTFESSAMLSLRNVLGVPPAKIPIDGPTFASYVLPLVICYFAGAVLVVTPRTRMVRLALWPLVPLLALRAALSVDMLQRSLDLNLAFFWFYVVSRTLDWALVKEPLVRHLRPEKSSPSTILDALDLAFNPRGIGWGWSRGIYVPRETRPSNRRAFIFHNLLSAVAHALIASALQRAVLTLAPAGTGPFPQGSTILDDTLALPVRYFRASVIATLTAFAIYAGIQMSHNAWTMLGVALLGYDPAQWPPMFDAPWRATSLGDFWGRRWHQYVRQTVLSLGGYPLAFVFGRPGVVVGAFLASAAMHHVGLMALDPEIEFWWMLGGFGMMGPGILAERAFSQLTGRQVGGVAGWLWTMTWMILWGIVMVEAFARAGMLTSVEFFGSSSSTWALVEQLAVGFDAWLHTL